MAGFTLTEEDVGLPPGAWSPGGRRTLRLDGRAVLSLTQGQRRAYLFPVYTPAGFLVTSESPADHPHHNSIWIAADDVVSWRPAGLRSEPYTYNLYVDDVFQGRAPGRILEVACDFATASGESCTIVQTLEWRGPAEWGAPEGRIAAIETRSLAIRKDGPCHMLDVASRLVPQVAPIELGPTRHAYFNVRVADSLCPAHGGTIRDDRGRLGGIAISGEGARFVDISGPVGGGHVAGVAVMPDPADPEARSWFVTDWGVITVGSVRQRSRRIEVGASYDARFHVLIHDGDAASACVEDRFSAIAA